MEVVGHPGAATSPRQQALAAEAPQLGFPEQMPPAQVYEEAEELATFAPLLTEVTSSLAVAAPRTRARWPSESETNGRACAAVPPQITSWVSERSGAKFYRPCWLTTSSTRRTSRRRATAAFAVAGDLRQRELFPLPMLDVADSSKASCAQSVRQRVQPRAH